MIFIRRENFRTYLRLYPVTALILAINLIVFAADYLFLNRELTIRGMLYQNPAFDEYGLQEPWRYITSMFLHGGWDHLLFNCFSTLVFAPPLERLLGHFRYAFAYLLFGIAGNVLSALVHAGTEHAAVGASGAIYGIFGAYLFLILFRKSMLDDASRKTVGTILAVGVIYSFIMPNIDIWGHVGGAIAGLAFMGLFVRNRNPV